MASLFRGELGRFPPALVSLLIKEMGIYPPGSFVRLASHEIAVVTHSGDKANQPRVAALRKVDGPPYADVLLRDTRQPACRVWSRWPLPRQRSIRPISPACGPHAWASQWLARAAGKAESFCSGLIWTSDRLLTFHTRRMWPKSRFC
jgi:hypothetical protein